MERRTYARTARLVALAGTLAAALSLVLLSGDARAATNVDAAPAYPADCGDPSITCGTGDGDSSTMTESWDA